MAIASLFFAASSCSDDLDEDNGIQNQDNSEKAYLSVTISSPYDDTRADALDNRFEYGTKDEQSINAATFCFYYENGNLASSTTVFQATLKDVSGADSLVIAENSHGTGTNPGTIVDDDIEFEGVTTVLVRNYSENRAPKYMLTILNAPSDFTAPATLDDALQLTVGEKELHNTANLPKSYMNGNKFIMTTSSYNRDTETNLTKKGYYYVTLLTEDDFHSTQAEAVQAAADGNSVNVYVERLAAKVRIALDNGLGATDVTDFNDNNSYPLVKIDSTFTIKGETDQDLAEGAEEQGKELYAEILGWGINTQPMLSYYFKHINTDWKSENSSLGFVWDAAIYHRSYWGESFPYGKLTAEGTTDQYAYPDEYVPAYATVSRATEESTENAQSLNNNDYHMFYQKANDLSSAMGTELYCPENTNNATVLNKVENYQAAVTCVLVKARLVDKDGVPQVVILYNNQLYLPKTFKELAIAGVASQFKSGSKGLTADDLKFDNAPSLNGRINVILSATGEAKSWTNAAGEAVTTVDINDALRGFTTNADAVAYGDPDKAADGDPSNGLMYYCIPIEHMRGGIQSKKELGNDKLRNIKEGQFGVVRNHIYDLSINLIKNLGHGIYNPDEPIVPPLEKDDRYYIGVKVNILSWHNVQQNVTL
jgi:hypothetical protein